MIGKDVHVAHRANRTGNWPILLLVISKGLRASSLFSAFKLLHELPLILFVFLVLFGSSLFFLGIQRPWNGSKKLRGKQWVRVVIYAIILVASTLLWNIGLKYYGPIRTILSSDYADFTMFYVVSTLISNSVFDSTKAQGAILIIISCLLLFFFSTTPSSGAPYGDTLYFGPFEADTIGGIALAIAVGLTIFRKGIARRLYGDIGGTKKLFSLSMGIASCVLFPFALFQYFTEPINMDSAALFSLLSVIAFVVVVDYYVESISNNQLDTSVTAQCSIIAGFLFGWVISWQYNLEGAGWLEWVCFALTIVGIRLLSGKASDAPALPLYSGSSVAPISSSQGFRHAMSILKMVIKQIVEKSTSRRIFTFLVVNLMFMFVELMYGIWTNSLGLITDAFHMLFDCTALFIALFAEVISQWDSNNVFSYGYSRVQVLSGFANGIFLVFISFYVLMESIERVMEPPDVKTDRLLLVSILGFAVNMVGIFSFHDHHHEGGEHDHGHGHSHGHGHGHGHSKEHKEKKIKNKDSHHDNCNDPKHAHGEHSHEHGHDHDHGHGHDHDHGHGHDHDHSHGHNHGHEKPHKKDKKEKAAHSHEHSENLQGVFLHLLADTLGSVGVIISSFIIQMWGWTIADPICSLFIAVLIFMSTIPLLKSASRTLMQCTPGHFVPKLDEVLGKITKLEGVLGYRDPHFWTYANNIIVGSIHIQVDEHINEQQILQTVTNMLKKKGVTHLVVEIEKPQARNRTPTMHLDHDDRPPHYSSGVDPLNL